MNENRDVREGIIIENQIDLEILIRKTQTIDRTIDSARPTVTYSISREVNYDGAHGTTK